jgi:hypothetical protein
MSQSFELKFDQDIVNMINKIYPERNWMICGGPVGLKVKDSFFSQETTFQAMRIPMPDFVFNTEIFWKQMDLMYNDYKDRTLIHDFIIDVCDWIMTYTDKTDIYLLAIHGQLESDGHNSHKADWVLRGTFEL